MKRFYGLICILLIVCLCGCDRQAGADSEQRGGSEAMTDSSAQSSGGEEKTIPRDDNFVEDIFKIMFEQSSMELYEQITVAPIESEMGTGYEYHIAVSPFGSPFDIIERDGYVTAGFSFSGDKHAADTAQTDSASFISPNGTAELYNEAAACLESLGAKDWYRDESLPVDAVLSDNKIYYSSCKLSYGDTEYAVTISISTKGSQKGWKIYDNDESWPFFIMQIERA